MRRHPWHPAIVHFPIACWVLATLFDLAAGLALHTSFVPLPGSDFAALLLWSGLVSAIPAIFAGLVDYARLDRFVQDSPELTSHMMWMSFAFVLFLGAALWRLRANHLEPPILYYITALEVAGTICLIRGGRLASTIVFEKLQRPQSLEGAEPRHTRCR